MINVVVVGGGSVGKRVAEYARAQSDMQVIGIVDAQPTHLIKALSLRGFPIYAPDFKDFGEKAGERERAFRDTATRLEILIAGSIDDALEQANIVVDATPKGIPAKNIPRYKRHEKPVIVEGGEKHALTGRSFHPFTNYRENVGAKETRVVSCNTTGAGIVLETLQPWGIDYVMLNLTRRGEDQVIGTGPLNVIEPVLGHPHHFEDLVTIMPYLANKGMASASAVPHTLCHEHSLFVRLEQTTTAETVRDMYEQTPRVRVMDWSTSGMKHTGQLAEYFLDLRRDRGDFPEVIMLGDNIHVDGHYVQVKYYVHMLSITGPSNIDAIRALNGSLDDPWTSIRHTDGCLTRELLPGFQTSKKVYASAQERKAMLR